MPEPRAPLLLTRNVRVLSGVSFLQDAASELLYPILPIFLTVTLGAPVVVVGMVEGVAEGLAAATKIVSGRYADRWARRPLVAAGYGLAAAGKVLIALASSWPVVLAGRGVDRVGKGLRGAPRDALLMLGVPVGQRGRVFGFHRAADTLGAVVGPLIGLAGYELLGHRIRPLLIIAIVPAVLSVLLVAAVRDGGARGGRARPPYSAAASPASPGPGFRRAVAVLTLFSLVNFPDALLLLRLHELGLGVAAVVGAYVAYNVSYAALSYPAGALADRWPKPRVYALGLCCFAVGKAWVSTLVEDGAQARAQGLFQGLGGTAVLRRGDLGRPRLGRRRPGSPAGVGDRRSAARHRPAARDHGSVRISAPESVTSRVCSNCAVRRRSFVSTVHPSSHMSQDTVPSVIMGSMVNVMPGSMTVVALGSS